MCAAINAMLCQPAFLLQFVGPSLRRAVTAPSVSRRTQWPQPCSSRRISRGCWQHSAVSHAPDDLPDGQRWRLQHAPDLIQMPLRHLARRRLCGLAAGRWRRSRRRAMLAVADGLHGCLLRGGFARRPELEHAFHGLLDQPVEVGDSVVHTTGFAARVPLGQHRQALLRRQAPETRGENSLLILWQLPEAGWHIRPRSLHFGW